MLGLIAGLYLIWLTDLISADRHTIDLYKHLMDYDRYEPAVRPTPDHRLATNVTFGFLLHQVINVDEKNQQLTTSSWMNVNWMDQRLRWNHSDWGGVKILHIPNQKVWKPDLILTNNADHEYKESIVSTDVFVTPEGNVTWLYFAIYQSACQIRVRFYPFDDQECSLTFASWSYEGSKVNLLLLTEEGDLSNYVNNSEWEMLSMTAQRKVHKFSVGGAPWPVVTITIKLGRRPLFYVFNHIIPCVLISIMSMLGFYIPAETGEKVTMCITTLLSMGVFLKTITESMPPSAEAIPLIGMYYVVSLFIVCAATTVNVVTLNVHNRGSRNSPKPIPCWARKYILGHMANWVCISIYPADVHILHLAERRRQIGNDDDLLQEIAISNNYSKKFGTPVVLKTAATTPESEHHHPAHSSKTMTSPRKMATVTARPAAHLDLDRIQTTVLNHEDHHLASKSRIEILQPPPPPPMDLEKKHSTTTLLKPTETGNQHDRFKKRATSQVFLNQHSRATRPYQSVMCKSISNDDQHEAAAARAAATSGATSHHNNPMPKRSIYDYDYQLESLRKLNSQAQLMSGALTLMEAPLDDGRRESVEERHFDPAAAMPMSQAPSYDNLARFDSLIGRTRLGSSVKRQQRPQLAKSESGLSGGSSTKRNIIDDEDGDSSRKTTPKNLTSNHHHHRPNQQKPVEEPNRSKRAPTDDAHRVKKELEEHFCRVLRKVYQTLQQNELRTSLQEERTQIMWEWKQLATVIDRLLLLLFVIATSMTTFLILFERAIFDDDTDAVRDDEVPNVI